MPDDSPRAIILYDGICGFCNRTVRFVLKRDSRDCFRFATLQSEFARALLQKHGIRPEQLESIVLVIDHNRPNERVQIRSTASITIFRDLGPFWRAMANVVALLPRALRDWAYDLVARYRYRIFGKYGKCPLPDASVRHKFLDVQ
jgi:predicted DCC family thiol-disulfide oxidoreductase YuxK